MENLHTQVESVKSDHHFFSLSNDELFEIVLKPDQWSKDDHQLAQKILNERRKEIDNASEMHWLTDLEEDERKHKPLIYAGYIFSILGGFVGIIIGIHLITSKKTLSDGKQALTYTIEDRQHGGQILIFGVIMFLLSIIINSL